jgi:hypothetical protein
MLEQPAYAAQPRSVVLLVAAIEEGASANVR